VLKKLIRTVKAKNRSKNTIVSIEQSLVKAEQAMGKPLETATFEDLLCYVERRKEEGLAATSIHIIESKFIQFYKYCFDETDDIRYNKMLRQLRNLIVDKPKTHINPQDILLPEDIKKLINVATLERDRCIIAVLFESGMRIGELLALTSSMIQMNEEKQEVVFNIPNLEGCKTGSRTVVCLEVYAYVQDWMKCNPSERFIAMSKSGVSKAVKILFEKAGITKPCNIHTFRHSSITNAVIIGMQQNAISMRYWGHVNSNMLATYINLSEMMQADAYRNAKGMNGDNTKIINPLASKCVECGRQVQTGSLCKTCADTKKLSQENVDLKAQLQKNAEENDIIKRTNREIMQQQEEMKKQMDFITAALQAKGSISSS
jgi:site-specific recombinase XerD